jgi:hypothetical protein
MNVHPALLQFRIVRCDMQHVKLDEVQKVVEILGTVRVSMKL